MLAFLVILAVPVTGVLVVGRRLRIAWPELVIVAILMTAIVPFGRVLGLTPSSTLLLSVVIGVGWLFFRRRRPRPAASEAPDPRPHRPVAQPVPRPAETAPAQAHTIFVSYRRSDSADITGRIYDRLAQRFGREHVYKEKLPSELRELAYRNGISARPDPDFHKDVDRLIAGLEDHFRRPTKQDGGSR